MRKCTHITKSLRRVGTEVCDFPTYEELPNLDTFLVEFEVKVLEEHGFLALRRARRVGGLFISSPSQFGRSAR